jgi:hypothetical protein
MKAWQALQALLDQEPEDAGCAETFAVINRYAEIVVRGGDPEGELPEVALHLARCGPCAEDFQGLLAALREEVETERSDPL